MSTCTNCSRPLKDGESGLCPACQSKDSSFGKKVTTGSVIGGIIVGVLLAILTGGRGGRGGRA